MAPQPKKRAAAKKRPAGAPAKPSNEVSKEAAKILAECSFQTALGLERAAANDPTKRSYSLDNDARDYWLTKHLRTIPNALKNPKNKWTVDRQFVLPQARDLGRIAMENALADAINSHSAGITVTKDHVKGASIAIAKGPICVAAKKGKLGSGPYCPE